MLRIFLIFFKLLERTKEKKINKTVKLNFRSRFFIPTLFKNVINSTLKRNGVIKLHFAMHLNFRSSKYRSDKKSFYLLGNRYLRT